MSKEPTNAKIHYRYWIGMLAGALILMIAIKWSTQPNFTEYIGNVATFTSLVLGVVAIFYSFTSNNSLSNSLGNITGASESLKRSEIEVRTVLDQSKVLANNHNENVQKMHQISDSVQGNVSMLSDTLREISEKTTELQSTLLLVPTRLDAISEKLDGKTQQAPVLPKDTGLSPDQAAYFNRVASVSGNLLTYGCAMAKSSQKDFSPAALNRLLGRNFPALSSGFMDCMAATGIIRRKSVAGNPGYWTILQIDAEVEKSIKEYLISFFNSAYAEEPEKKNKYLDMLTSIESEYGP